MSITKPYKELENMFKILFFSAVLKLLLSTEFLNSLEHVCITDVILWTIPWRQLSFTNFLHDRLMYNSAKICVALFYSVICEFSCIKAFEVRFKYLVLLFSMFIESRVSKDSFDNDELC